MEALAGAGCRDHRGGAAGRLQLEQQQFKQLERQREHKPEFKQFPFGRQFNVVRRRAGTANGHQA